MTTAMDCATLKALLQDPTLDCKTAAEVLSIATIDPLTPYQRHMTVVAQIVCVISGTIILWEYFSFLSREWWIIRKSRMSLGIIALLVNRYAGVLSVISGAILILGNPSSCEATGWVVSLSFAIQQAASSFIFALRVRAIWQKNRWVTYGVTLGCFIVTGAWFASAWSLTYTEPPASLMPWGGRCIAGGHVATWRVVSVSSTTAFDLAILVLTLVGLMAYRSERESSQNSHHFVRKLALASLIYWVPVCIANISAIVILTTRPNLRTLATTYTYAISQIAASRLIFDMQSTFGVRDRSDHTGAFTYPSGSAGAAGTPRDDKYTLTTDDTRTQEQCYDVELAGGEVLNETSSKMSPQTAELPLASLPYEPSATASHTLTKDI